MGVFIARRFPKHALWNDDATALLKPDGGSLNTQALQALLDDRENRKVGYENEQPADITAPVKAGWNMICTFESGLWSATSGTPTLTQGHTGWNGSGALSPSTVNEVVLTSTSPVAMLARVETRLQVPLVKSSQAPAASVASLCRSSRPSTVGVDSHA